MSSHEAVDPPHDLQPKTTAVRLELPVNAEVTTIRLDPQNTIPEITEANNTLNLGN